MCSAPIGLLLLGVRLRLRNLPEMCCSSSSRKCYGFFRNSPRFQVAVTRLCLGMWQTMTILQCPPRQTLLPDPTVKT